MDPHHRDRVALVRLCFGHFRRGETIAAVAARWVESDNVAVQRRFMNKHRTMLAIDRDGALVFLPEST